MTELDGPAGGEHPRPSHIPDIEYEDEPPGSYLGEFRVGWLKITWSVINIVLVTIIRYAGAESAPLETIWAILPASCILSLCVTLWLLIVSRMESGKLPVLACILLDTVSIVLRLFI